MPRRLNEHLDNFRNFLKVDPAIKANMLRELYTHLEDRSQELEESGFSEDAATEMAVSWLGSPSVIARQICEVYSQGSWRQALFAALPHFVVALLFSLRIWQSTTLLSFILVAVIGVVIYGWWHSKPAWLFPWLGYYFIPVIVAGILLVYLPGSWFWFAAVAYLPLALFVLISVTKQTINQDWLYASVMLLPIPILLSWILALGTINSFSDINRQLQDMASWIALSFLILAATVTIFIRIRQRWAKAGALLTPEVLALTLIAVVSQGAISFWLWLILASLSVFLLLSPAVLEKTKLVRKGK